MICISCKVAKATCRCKVCKGLECDTCLVSHPCKQRFSRFNKFNVEGTLDFKMKNSAPKVYKTTETLEEFKARKAQVGEEAIKIIPTEPYEQSKDSRFHLNDSGKYNLTKKGAISSGISYMRQASSYKGKKL